VNYYFLQTNDIKETGVKNVYMYISER